MIALTIPQWPRRKRTRACVESLESRLLLSGNVVASVYYATLTLVGDVQDNSVIIDQVGLGANQFRVSSGDGTTTINGSLTPQIFTGAALGISVNLGAGNDTVLIQNAVVAESLHLTGSSGNKTSTLNHLTVDGNVYVQTGSTGVHNLTLTSCTIQRSLMASNNPAAGGSVYITNGAGASDTVISQAAVLYALAVTNSAGPDNFSLSNSSVGGGVTLANGAGDTNAAFNQASITNLLSVTNGDGNNSFSYSFCNTGAIQISNGNGDTLTTLANSTIVGALTVTNLNGTHGFSMNACAINFCGAFVQLLNGNGDSGISFDNSAITAAVLVVNGTGDAGFEMDATSVFTVAISNGDGAIATDLADSLIGGWLVVKNGLGSHALSVDSTQIYGYINLSNGSGDSAVSITNTTVRYGFALANQDSDNSLIFENSTFGGNVVIADGLGNCFATIATTLIDGNLTITSSGLAIIDVIDSIIQDNATIAGGAGSSVSILPSEVGVRLSITT